jgi:hypothetical protein
MRRPLSESVVVVTGASSGARRELELGDAANALDRAL